MKPRKPIRRTSPLPKGAPPRKVNPKRKAAEFARCYLSEARVAFVKPLPCLIGVLCDYYYGIDNAHVGNGGAGRKAHYSKIVPLCRRHHAWLGKGRAAFERTWGLDLDVESARVQAAWLDHERAA